MNGSDAGGEAPTPVLPEVQAAMQTKEAPGFNPNDVGAQTGRVTAEIVRTEDGQLLTKYHAHGRTYRSLDELPRRQR